MPKTPVLFNHDAAIDEYMAAVLLTTMDDYDLQGIVVTNADCIDRYAMQVMWKILSYIKRTDIPVALSDARGLNPFPWVYRGDCIREDGIAALWNHEDNPAWKSGFPSGESLLADALTAAIDDENPLTLLVNCPLTTLAGVLKNQPDLVSGISRMIWMGGAINVSGNLDPATLPPQMANPTAEWNVFWDPPSTEWVLENTSFPITVFPLDVTNQAAITKEFMSDLEQQAKTSRVSRLAYESYQLVAKESFYDMWDVVTTCYLTRPDLFQAPAPMKLSVVTEGFYQGTLHQTEDGREVDVILNLEDSAGFYEYVLQQFNRCD